MQTITRHIVAWLLIVIVSQAPEALLLEFWDAVLWLAALPAELPLLEKILQLVATLPHIPVIFVLCLIASSLLDLVTADG
ncbi:MAG: hypothetical protein ACUVXF_00735 [Desulfobaccales bacterium]